jgi:hypothetical protein
MSATFSTYAVLLSNKDFHELKCLSTYLSLQSGHEILIVKRAYENCIVKTTT